MSYPKIYEVLPKDIILQIQDYMVELDTDLVYEISTEGYEKLSAIFE